MNIKFTLGFCFVKTLKCALGCIYLSINLHLLSICLSLCTFNILTPLMCQELDC